MNVRPEVLGWIAKADRDLVAAHHLADADEPLPDQLGFFCQQAAEKYLKAYLSALGQMPPRTHDVDVLLELCAEMEPAFQQLQSVVEGLTEFAVTFRYPEEWSDQASAMQALDKAEQVRALVRHQLGLSG